MKFRLKYLFQYLFQIKRIDAKRLSLYKEELENGVNPRDLRYVLRIYRSADVFEHMMIEKKILETEIKSSKNSAYLIHLKEKRKRLNDMTKNRVEAFHEYKPFLVKYNLFFDLGIRSARPFDIIELVEREENLDNQIKSNVVTKKFNL